MAQILCCLMKNENPNMDILHPAFENKITYMAEIPVWDKGCTRSSAAENKEIKKGNLCKCVQYLGLINDKLYMEIYFWQYCMD